MAGEAKVIEGHPTDLHCRCATGPKIRNAFVDIHARRALGQLDIQKEPGESQKHMNEGAYLFSRYLAGHPYIGTARASGRYFWYTCSSGTGRDVLVICRGTSLYMGLAECLFGQGASAV